MNRNNLVIVRAGKNSLHPKWVSGPFNFDLLVAAYDQDAMRQDAHNISYRFVPGSKVHGWNVIANKYSTLINNYERIALIDDDIDCNSSTLNRIFDIGKEYRLSIWQPSLTHGSFATYAASLQNDHFLLRYVNYIEMMCPFFARNVFNNVSKLFGLGFESGIDLIWCSIARELGGRCAIIDECVVTHTKPVGKQKQLNGFVDREYEADIYKCLGLFNMEWPSWVSDAAIHKNSELNSGFILKLRAITPLLNMHLAPKGNRLYRLKAALDHLRHQVFRESSYGNEVIKKLDEFSKKMNHTKAT